MTPTGLPPPPAWAPSAAPARGPLLSVVIPTYNEAANIAPLLQALDAALPGIDLEYVVVDDDSSDGTARLAQAANPRVRVIVRKGERGLATAVVRGLREARGEYVAVMDADFQHPPPTVRALLDQARRSNADLVVGSRYARGGSEGNFGAVRRIISAGARKLSNATIPTVRNFRVTDPMSGLFLVRRDRIEGVDLRPTGYKILLEVLGRCPLRRVEEVGYTFQDRRGGASKLGPAVMLQYIVHLLALGWQHPENVRILRFMAVGASGSIVTLGLLWQLHELAGLEASLANLIGVAAGIQWNFLLNDRFTFPDRRDAPWGSRWGMFNVVSLGGLTVNFTAFFLLHYFGGLHPILAGAGAILAAFAANFLGNSRLTYGGERRPRPRQWLPVVVLVVVASGFYFTTLNEPRGVYFDESYYLATAYQMENGVWTDPCWQFDAAVPDMPLNYEHPPLGKLILYASIHAYDDYRGVFKGCRLPDQTSPDGRAPAECYVDHNEATTATFNDMQLKEGDKFDTGQRCFQGWIHDMQTYGNPYAWRGPSALFGVITVAFAALAARRIFQSEFAGALAGALVIADTLVLSTARIALLDIFATGFAVMAIWAATFPTRKGVLGTFLFLGLGFACKYYVLFVGPPIAVLSLWIHWRHGRLTKRRFDWHWVSALAIPPAVWVLSYIPWFAAVAKAKGIANASAQFLVSQARAISWDTGVGASGADQGHQYQSKPIEWLMMSKPMSYIGPAGPTADTVGAYIYAVGNPILWWAAALAIAIVLLAFVVSYLLSLARHPASPVSFFAGLPRAKQALLVTALVPLLGYLCFFLLQRTTYIFYMTLIVPFFAILLAGALAYLWSFAGRLPKAATVAVLVLVGLAFLWFFQVSIYMPIPRDNSVLDMLSGQGWPRAPGTDIHYPALGFNDVMQAIPWMEPYGSWDCWSKESMAPGDVCT